MGSIADKPHQSLLELDGCRTRECEHQQLLMLNVLKQKQRGEFMHQDACLSTARSGSNNDAMRLLVGDYLHLLR